MNTNDVRNMEKTQWVFWAAALPLTAIVIIVSLFAAGILAWPFSRRADLFRTDEQLEVNRSKRRTSPERPRRRYYQRDVDSDDDGW